MSDPSTLDLLQAFPHGRHVYIRTHHHKNVLRFTKLTATIWKHTDGNARPGGYIRTADLANLGTITTFKETTP